MRVDVDLGENSLRGVKGVARQWCARACVYCVRAFVGVQGQLNQWELGRGGCS